MKIKLLITFIFLIISNHSYSCKIETYRFIYKIENFINNKIIKNSNCDQETNAAFINFITSASGRVPTKMISLEISKTNNKLQIYPTNIEVINLKNYLKENLSLNSNQKIESIKPLNNEILVSDDYSRPIIHCDNCEKNGNQNLKITYADKSFWFNINILSATKVWVPKFSILPYSSDLQKKDFKLKVIYTKDQNNYFQNIEKIRFYKTTKKLKDNNPLRINDLTAQTLIRPGKKVTLILKGKNIQLKNTVISKQPGKLGEIIEFKNINSNKKFYAKVIDFNKAEIEL